MIAMGSKFINILTKGRETKEILFKSQTSFRILGVEENCINLVETKGETVDFVLSKDFKC